MSDGAYSPEHPKYPDVIVQLSGSDGNAMTVIGKVAVALRGTHGAESARLFVGQAIDAASYHDLLILVMSTVKVE